MLGVSEFKSVAFRGEPVVCFSKAKIPRVVVQAKAVNAIEETAILLGDLLKESARPV